jgi:hypothetical protein
MASKNQLVVTDLSGYHADNLPETITRLQRGGSWLKQRIVVIIPAADLVPAKCVLSWWNLAFPPNNGVVKIIALGDEVGVAYSNAIEWVLAHPELRDWEYILSVEHDNAPPPDGVVKLVERMHNNPQFAAISGGYYTKGFGGVFQAWGDINDPIPNSRPVLPRTDGQLQEVYGLGMGFCLFRLAMFKDPKIEKPWFKTLNGKDGTGIGTQDLVFWGKARKAGYRCAVDGEVRVGHYDLRGDFGPPDTMW